MQKLGNMANNCIRSIQAVRRLHFEASTTSFLHIESEVVRGVDLVCSVYPLHIFSICPNFVKLLDVLPLADFPPINKIEPMAFCLEFLFISSLSFLSLLILVLGANENLFRKCFLLCFFQNIRQIKSLNLTKQSTGPTATLPHKKRK